MRRRAPRVVGPLGRAVRGAAGVADELFARRQPAVARRLSAPERRTEAVAAGLFVVCAGLMALGRSAPVEHAASAALLVVCYALMRRVRFPLGPGLIRPTQLVFVPMVFLTPAALVPALVGAGSVLGELPDVARRRAGAERLLVVVSDSWYSVGPAAVVALWAPARAADAGWGLLVLALAAQFLTDLAASSLREWFGAAVRPAEMIPVLGLVYLVDATLSPVGYLAVLVADHYQYAYLLAIAPGAVLGLLAGERGRRIALELELERAFRRTTRALDARTRDLRRQTGWLQRPERRLGEALPTPEDRAALERLLLMTAVDALQADCGRLSARSRGGPQPRVTIGRTDPMASSLDAAERTPGRQIGPALAVEAGSEHVIAIGRETAPVSRAERELLEHLAAQAALALENLHLGELVRRTEAELRAILEGVADAILVEDPLGEIVYRNAAADSLLGDEPDLASTLGVAAGLLPASHVFDGEPPQPLVVRHGDGRRWSRVKSSPVEEHGAARLAISVVEDITEIKRAEEAQRFLAESSRVLASSPDVEETLPRIERLAAGWLGGSWTIDVDPTAAGPSPASADAFSVPIRVRGGVAGTITLSAGAYGPLEVAVAEDLGLRVGAAIDIARLYRTRAVVSQALQATLLPPVPPEIPGLETAGLYRPAGTGHELGGDFYDVFATGPDTWFLVIGDVRARGAEAAATSALARHTMRAAAMHQRSPADVLRRLNAVMLGQRTRAFVGVACARLDLHDRLVVATVACGGNPAPRVLRANGVVEALGRPGTLLGVLAGIEPADETMHLRGGDALILYTERLTQAAAPAVWTPEQLHTIVTAALGRTADGIVDHIAATIEGPLRDNLALLAVRVRL